MKRAGEVHNEIERMISQGEKPSAKKIAETLEYSSEDVHRCINFLEQENKVKSYTKTVMGNRYRFLSLYRE